MKYDTTSTCQRMELSMGEFAVSAMKLPLFSVRDNVLFCKVAPGPRAWIECVA